MPVADEPLWRALDAAADALSEVLQESAFPGMVDSNGDIVGHPSTTTPPKGNRHDPYPERPIFHPWVDSAMSEWSDATSDQDEYIDWYSERYGSPPPPGSAQVRDDSPLISVVVPVYKPEMWYFRQCVESVRRQTWPKWELCLCDDGSGDPALSAYLHSLESDPRIKVTSREANGGISAATNDAIAMATGEFIALLDNDDELVEIALESMAAAIEGEPEADVLYSDEDKIDYEGRLCIPSFKPAWSPEYLLSTAYTCHLTVLRTSLVRRLGGMRTAFDGSQDYDITLRATEQARRVVHVPEILYHWRMVRGSAAEDMLAKPWAHDASRRALEAALARRGEQAEVLPGPQLGTYHVRRVALGSDRATVVIQTTGNTRSLRRCVEAVLADPGHPVELVIVDRASTDLGMPMLLEELAATHAAKILRTEHDQGWSDGATLGAELASGSVVVFVDDTTVRAAAQWLSVLFDHATRKGIAAAGGRLLSPSGDVVHAGMVVGLGGPAGSIYSGLPMERHGYLTAASMGRNYSAVSGACLATTAALLDQLGGFDPALPDALGDIDYCLRAAELGLRTVYTPIAQLVVQDHIGRHECYDAELATFAKRWEDLLRHGDPYFNPNLSRTSLLCGLGRKDDEDTWNLTRAPRSSQGGVATIPSPQLTTSPLTC